MSGVLTDHCSANELLVVALTDDMFAVLLKDHHRANELMAIVLSDHCRAMNCWLLCLLITAVPKNC